MESPSFDINPGAVGWEARKEGAQNMKPGLWFLLYRPFCVTLGERQPLSEPQSLELLSESVN